MLNNRLCSCIFTSSRSSLRLFHIINIPSRGTWQGKLPIVSRTFIKDLNKISWIYAHNVLFQTVFNIQEGTNMAKGKLPTISKTWSCVTRREDICMMTSGLHKLWHPGIRDTSTWSKFGAHEEHGDVFLFSNLGALWFSENLIRYSLHVCLREVKTIFFPSNTLIYGISRDGSKNLNIRTCEHMILGQLRVGTRQAKNAPLSWPSNAAPTNFNFFILSSDLSPPSYIS